MNKKRLLKMLNAKEERKKELQARGQKTEEIGELRSINTELEGLNEDIAELRGMIDAIEEEERNNESTLPPGEIDPEIEVRAADPIGETQILATYGMRTAPQEKREGQDSKKESEKLEQRGKDLKAKKAVTYDLNEVPELRAVTIGSSNLAVPTRYNNTVNKAFNEVSKVIDVVNVVPLNGGEAYQKAFEVQAGEGDYSTEEGEYTDTDPVFDYVSINKAKITAYTELSDESMKLPDIAYQDMVKKSITKAIRKKASKQIVVGPGGSNALIGIFKAPAKVIPLSSDLAISEIGPDTLDNIVINYGGDEEVEGNAYLILNKRDLAAFATVRDNNLRKLYKIKVKGNTGTISSDESFEVPFIINSICPALSSADTAVDTYCMAYGMMQAYEMPVFSELTVEESRDFKFKTGQIAYRGSVYAGGNVAMYKGFIRIKKKAAE